MTHPIARLALFGATGDLAGRFLLPALAALHAAGRLPAGFTVVGAATKALTDDGFRNHARERLDRHAADVPAEAREAVVRALSYRRVDVADPASVARVVAGQGSVLAYLALPTRVFPQAVTALAAVGLPPGSRVALEKPFGENLEDARALNALVAREIGDRAYRVDHALGLPSVWNLFALRCTNPVLDAFWDARHVERVELLWEETLALEGRAGFYDHAGALRDVLQNHVLQLLALVAMELPSPGAGPHDQRLAALRATRLVGTPAACTRRARYTAGTLADAGRAVPDYVDELGVDALRETETFAELTLEVTTPRWAGIPFVMRAGKALSRRRKEIVLSLRPQAGSGNAPSRVFEIGIDGPHQLQLTLVGASESGPAPVTLVGHPPPARLPAYGHVLLDILGGGDALAVRGDVAEECWRIVTPALTAWSKEGIPMEEYPAGSSGPALRTGPR